MSIADKLTYLDTTKQLLKTEINKINNVLDDNSTFRSYPQELFNGYLDILNNGTDTLWSNLEKVSQIGTEAVLENVENAPMKMVLNGNTSQETTTGKNLLGLTNGTYSHNGITAVVNDGTITITGTATANSFINIPLLKDIVLSNEQVTASINNATTISDTATEFRVYESGTNYIPVLFTTINRKTTTTKTGTFVSAYVRTTSGVSYGDGIVIKPQLELGSTATSWEKYTGGQPSPSPDYPQQVKVVKGENVVSVSGKNRFTTDYLTSNNFTTYAKLSDNSFSFTATGTWKKATYNMPCKPNTDYYFNISSASSMYIQIKGVQTGTQLLGRYSAYLISFNSGENTELEINIGIGNNSIASGTISDIQLEEGSTATDFVPYSKTDYPISLGTIEMCKIGDYKDYFHKDSGKWYVHKEIGKVVLDGSESWEFASKSDTPTPRSVILLSSYIDFQSLIYYSNYFTNDDENTSNRLRFYVQQSVYRKEIYLSLDNEIVGISSNDNNATRLQKIKTWLSTHNVTLYYVLATPTEEEITNTTLIEQLEAISKAKSVKDKTYITQTNDELPFILDVEAIKEYEVN